MGYYSAKRGRRRWGRRYRRYRHPSGSREMSEVRVNVLSFFSTQLNSTGFNYTFCLWNQAGSSNVVSLYSSPFLQELVATYLWERVECKAIKVKLFVHRPGSESLSVAPYPTIIAPGTIDPGVQAGSVDGGYRARGYILAYRQLTWNKTTGAPIPNAFDETQILNLYPESKLRALSNNTDMHGKCAMKFFMHIPKEFRQTPWLVTQPTVGPPPTPASLPPPPTVGADSTFGNVGMNIVGIGFQGSSTQALHQVFVHTTFYVKFYGRIGDLGRLP